MKSYKILVNRELEGEITPIPSKSTIHRSLICALLVRGKTTITNLIDSVDVRTTMEIIEKCGAKIIQYEEGIIVDSTNLKNPGFVRVNESGSTLRFIVPVLLYLFNETNIEAKPGLIQRPHELFLDIFAQSAINCSEIKFPLQVRGEIQATDYKLAGNISSQFISGLLFVLPLMEKDSRIIFTSKIESKGYIDLTIDILAQFGIEIFWENEQLIIKGKQQYQKNIQYVNEIDASNLPYWKTLQAFYPKIKINSDEIYTKQPDNEFSKIITTTDKKISVAPCPDLLPILATYFGLKQYPKTLIDTQRTKIKESNRLLAIKTELVKLGLNIKIDQDENLVIGKSYNYQSALVSGTNDHRIVMSLAIAACITKKEVIISQADAVAKSDPYFFDTLRSIGAEITVL